MQRRAARSPSDQETADPWAFLLRRVAVALLTLVVAASFVFFAIHLGPRAPVDSDPADPDDAAAFEQRKEAFGLKDPLVVQYADYMTDTFTLDFGESWTTRQYPEFRVEPVTDLNKLVLEKLLPRTAWLWLWAALIALVVGLPLGLALGYLGWSSGKPKSTVSSALIRAGAVFLVATLIEVTLTRSELLLFGLDWSSLFVDGGVYGPIALHDLTDPDAFFTAVKKVLPAALGLSVGILGTTIRLGERAVRDATGPGRLAAQARGAGPLGRVRATIRNAALPLTTALSANVAVLIGGSLFVEIHFTQKGLGQTFVRAVGFGDYTTVQAIAFVFVLAVVVARLLESILYVWLVGPPVDRDERASSYWTGVVDSWGGWDDGSEKGLVSLDRSAASDIWDRIRTQPRPVLAWVGAGLVLLALQFGAVLDTLALVPGVSTPDLPTLLSRDLIPNQGHRTPGGGWTGTFLDLPAALAWAIRVLLVYLYAAAWVGWLVWGYRRYRTRYREAARTPLDATLGRLRASNWATFGLVVVFVFVVAAVFAPTLGPTTFERNEIDQEGDSGPPETFEYLDENGEIRLATDQYANLKVKSDGRSKTNVGPGQYDQFDRFHPFGTTHFGHDLFTSMVYGARTYLLVGLVAALVAGTIALVTGVLAGTRGGLFDTAGALAAEMTAALPLLPMAFFFVDQFQPAIPDPTTGSVFLAAAVGALAWPLLWRTLRAPAARAAEGGWIDAVRGFDGSSSAILRRHLLPRFAGHTLAYLLYTAMGAMIAYTTINTLWGGTVHYVRESMGTVMEDALFSVAWHTDAVPLVLVLTLFVGIHALADGVRAAVDPTGEEGVATTGETVAAGGAG